MRPRRLRPSLHEAEWAANLAQDVCRRQADGERVTMTWLNHASALACLAAGVDLRPLTHVGVDGTLLRAILGGSPPRTSADLVIPLLLQHCKDSPRVGLLGSHRDQLLRAAGRLSAYASKPQVVFLQDGYAGRMEPDDLAAHVAGLDLDLLIIGLGAPLQDAYAAALARAEDGPGVVMTCGGWLDQVTYRSYYPRLAYKLKLNWLVRLAREPRRLWRRYTVVAAAAVLRRRSLRRYVLVDGDGAFQRACAAATAGSDSPVC